MGRNSTYNILMYSHDTYGLGHIRRCMAIAANLCDPKINILILTGSPISGRFTFPEQVDFVRIPGMIKKTNEEYQPLSIKINARHALEIRKNIITATAKAFQPHLFIVDKEPLGLKKEILPALQWIKRCLPGTRTVLGLRDIMDDAQTVRRDWAEKGIYQTLDALYSEIWIYGHREFYDPISEYAIPANVSRKIHFTGYIHRKIPTKDASTKIRRDHDIVNGERLVVVTAGGGGDGYQLMDNFLSMYEALPDEHRFKCVMVSGPFMPKDQRRNIFKRADRLGLRTYHFFRRMETIFSAADLVVCMGGYNTLCEILNLGKVPLIIPRESPRKEQLLRAKALNRHHLADYIPVSALTPKRLGKKILDLLAEPDAYLDAIANFRFTGIEVIRQRIKAFRCKRT